MKNIYLLILSILSLSIYAQNVNDELENNAEAEMKSVSTGAVVAANPNTANYDITKQVLEFTVNPAVYAVSGKVTHTFTALSNMTTITFDLYKKTTAPFTISSVKMNGSNLIFEYLTSHELRITLPTTLSAGNSAIVEIVYSGVPVNSGSQQGFYTGTHGIPSKPVLWTLSEPFGARTWWPCKNDLTDKVSDTEIYITAPIAYSAASNGVEFRPQTNDGVNKTTYFKHLYAIPSYLVAISVTNYQIFNQTAGTVTTGTFPIVNYLYPEEFAAVTSGPLTTFNALTQTPAMINFFETVIGPYPFRNEKYGHARSNLDGGMEHSTVSSMNSWSRNLISHELAHQWFGDKITCGTWKDIWLNESLTEYMSGCYVEFSATPADFVNWKNSRINAGLSYGGSDNNLYLTDAQAMNVNRIFDQPITYYKGALVANMLRVKMGSLNFFLALRNYLNTYAYDFAETNDLRLKLEEVNGSGTLIEFFNDWVYGLGHPSYSVVAQNVGIGQVKFTVNQTQSDPSVSFFEMPVLVRALGASGQQQDFILNVTTNGQEFIQSVSFPVIDVVFDPNKEIFSENSTAVLSNSKFEYLAENTSLYPNPASEKLEIRLPKDIVLKSVSVYNLLGQKVLSSAVNTLFVESLNSGIYNVQIETLEGVFNKKFIKK